MSTLSLVHFPSYSALLHVHSTRSHAVGFNIPKWSTLGCLPYPSLKFNPAPLSGAYIGSYAMMSSKRIHLFIPVEVCFPAQFAPRIHGVINPITFIRRQVVSPLTLLIAPHVRRSSRITLREHGRKNPPGLNLGCVIHHAVVVAPSRKV